MCVPEGVDSVSESVEYVVAPVSIERATKTMRDDLRRYVDFKVHVLFVHVTNDLVTGRHLNLRNTP